MSNISELEQRLLPMSHPERTKYLRDVSTKPVTVKTLGKGDAQLFLFKFEGVHYMYNPCSSHTKEMFVIEDDDANFFDKATPRTVYRVGTKCFTTKIAAEEYVAFKDPDNEYESGYDMEELTLYE